MFTSALVPATTGSRVRARSLSFPARLTASALPICHSARPASLIEAVGLGCAQFLCTYTMLHIAHAKGVHLPLVDAISSIPLFSIFVASFALGAAMAVPAAAAFRKAGPRRPPLSLILTLAIGVFGIAVLLVP